MHQSITKPVGVHQWKSSCLVYFVEFRQPLTCVWKDILHISKPCTVPRVPTLRLEFTASCDRSNHLFKETNCPKSASCNWQPCVQSRGTAKNGSLHNSCHLWVKIPSLMVLIKTFFFVPKWSFSWPSFDENIFSYSCCTETDCMTVWWTSSTLPLNSTREVAVSGRWWFPVCFLQKIEKKTPSPLPPHNKVWPFVLWIWRRVNKACSLWTMRSLAEIIGLCCNDPESGITYHILKSWSARP